MRARFGFSVLVLVVTAGAAWPIWQDCVDVNVTTCYVKDAANPPLYCCDWGGWGVPSSMSCPDAVTEYPDACGATTGHLYGQAVGSVAVKSDDECGTIAYQIRTGWMLWVQEYDWWYAIWHNFQWVDQIIVKNRGEPPTTYDHTVHLNQPPSAPGPCEYWKFASHIEQGYEKCCTVLTY